jgi:PIN domain nuclease of toxin-antitoxin system
VTTEFLFDRHLLLWAAAGAGLPSKAEAVLRDPEIVPIFSAASIWEVAIKARLGRPDFKADANLLRRGLLDNGYVELPVKSAHAAAVTLLPGLHKDPFDRMLVAQAIVEGVVLLTADAMVARYPGPIELV